MKSDSSWTSEVVMSAALAAVDALGKDADVFYVGDSLGVTEWFVVATGSNHRQVRSIVEKVEEQVAISHDITPLRIEGKTAGEWVLMDFGDFVVHVFIEEARDFYDLSRLWSDMPRMELASGTTVEP